jgi:TldD protein
MPCHTPISPVRPGAANLSLPAWLAGDGAITSLAPADTVNRDDYFGDAFGIGNSDMDRLMAAALQGGGGYCDLFFQHAVGTWIVMEDGLINRAHSTINLGLGVRVIKGEQTGYAYSQVLDMDQMLKAAQNAASLANGGGQAPGSEGLNITPLELRPSLNLYACEVPWWEVSVERRMDLLRSVDGILKDCDPSIVNRMLYFHDSYSHIMLANSDGVLRRDLRPRCQLTASCVAEKNGQRESNYYDITRRAGLELFSPDKLREIAEGAAQRTLQLFEAKTLPAGEMPCVLGPGDAGILLHEAIGHGMEADFNRRRISTYADRLGQKVAGEQVTVVDDGTIANSHGAINCDDEGGDSQRTVLVEKGVLKNFLQDRLSSTFYQTGTTGSGRRQSYRFSPMPRMRATFMEPGPHKPAEVIAAVKKGLYAEQFTNGQVNIGAGDFSFYVKSGWAIENGKLAHPVKDINVTGNGPQVLSRITMVADDLALADSGFMCGKNGQTVPVSQGLPTTLVSSINVGGASQQ